MIRQENERHTIWKERSKELVADNMLLYIKKVLRNPPKKGKKPYILAMNNPKIKLQKQFNLQLGQNSKILSKKLN